MDTPFVGTIAASSGRVCGACSLCCKLPQIEPLEKPAGKLCSHCNAGNGCSIYGSRPQVCRDFSCFWLAGHVNDAWYPPHAKLMVDIKGKWIMVQVDPGSPNRWRQEPYFSQIKYWATFGIDRGVWVLVSVKKRLRIVLPNKEIDLGTYQLGDYVTVGEIPSPGGRDWTAVLRKAKDLTPEQRDRFAIR
jgi:hypothetical protein